MQKVGQTIQKNEANFIQKVGEIRALEDSLAHERSSVATLKRKILDYETDIERSREFCEEIELKGMLLSDAFELK